MPDIPCSLPPELAALKQFCIRVGKQPFIKNPNTGELTPKWTGGDDWTASDGYLTFTEAKNLVEQGVTVRVKEGDKWVEKAVEGIGYLNTKASDPERQIVGGDLDACKDPISDWLSPSATAFLKSVKPFYLETSPSKCGVRFFVLGRLPGRKDSLAGNGPQDDISPEIQERIIANKPKVAEKVAKGEPAWNGLELYEANRHLTLTGLGLYPGQSPMVAQAVDMTDPLAAAIKDFKPPAKMLPAEKQAQEGTPDPLEQLIKDAASGGSGKFPSLSIRDVIDTSGFEEDGDQLAGPHPTLGSTTGRNLLVNPSKNEYCYMHNGCNAGGDAWVWLAHECGAVDWEVKGEGLLRDPEVVSYTLEHALKRGLITEEDLGPKINLSPKEVAEEEFKQTNTFNPKLELRLEPSNFISKYMVYAKTTSDAYDEYHFASGLVLLSVAVDRQIVVSMRHGDIFPNIWIFPIGDSTISRKTTAYKLCKLIIKTKFPKKSLPSSFSPEALMDAIASTPRCYYLKDEAGSLLASLCKDYMAETRDFMAEIYECDDYYRKLKKSECEIIDPYITQLLMTTPDNLKEYTSPLDLTSGWLLRYMWMYPNYPKEWKPFAEKTSSDFELYTTIYGEYNRVVETLTNFRRLYMTSEAMDYFQTWQQAVEEKAMDEADNITKALAGRLMTHAIKMAALFTVGRVDFDVNSKIELPHVQEACRLVVEYFLPIGKIVIDEVARAESKNIQDKIIGVLKRNKGRISQRDLLRALHMKIKEVEEALEALNLSEEIESFIKKGKRGDERLYYRLKECHSVLLSHDEVYKQKNKGNKGSLYTPSRDSKTHLHLGQHRSSVEEDIEKAAKEEKKRADHFKTPTASKMRNGAKPTVEPTPSTCKCKSVEDVVNCLDYNLTEIQNPVLADWLHKQGLPYIPVIFQLRDRGWKQDDATRTMYKEAEVVTA